MKKKGVTLGFDWGYITGGGKPSRIKRFMTELRYGMQRFARGYDDSMFRNFGDHLDLLIMEDLRYMVNHRRGTTFGISQEEFTEILKSMLSSFEQARNEELSESARNEHHETALELLRQHYKNLWD